MLIAGGGCSGDGMTADSTPEKRFSAEETAAMKKAFGSGPAFRQIAKFKTLERKGIATVKYPGDRKGTRTRP
jgi:hypothetical protein